MSQIFGPPPPLGPEFDDNVAGRVKAKRLRRRAGAVGAATLVIALTGATIAVATSGNAQHETLLRTASSPSSQTSSVPTVTEDSTTSTTVPGATSTTAAPTTAAPTTAAPTTAAPVTDPSATVPLPTAPSTTSPPTTTPVTTASQCPSGGVFLSGTVDAIKKGTDANGVPTWLVTATATITNTSSATVDVGFWVTVLGQMPPPAETNIIVFDAPFTDDNPLTLSPGEAERFPLINYDPVGADGSNAVATTPPDSIYQGVIDRRWHDLTQRSSCPVPTQGAPFDVSRGITPGFPDWPGM